MDRFRKNPAKNAGQTPEATQPDQSQWLNHLVDSTGLPRESTLNEVDQIFNLSGMALENASLDDLRQAMLKYLEALDQEMRSGADLFECAQSHATVPVKVSDKLLIQ